MQALLDVILPVFLVIGFGYLSVWKFSFPPSAVDGLMKFTQNFAIPCLLFNSIAHLDLALGFDPWMLLAFYSGALSGFLAGLFGARFLFGRDWEDCVAIGFCCLFSNSVMLGLAITERAYGPDALTNNFAIVALHSPFCYGIGITVMEFVRNRDQSKAVMMRNVAKAMFKNALIIGIGLGFFVNFAGLQIPEVLQGGLDMMVRAALPAALFGMGGVLYQYRPEGDIGPILMVCAISLGLHPMITWTLSTGFAIPDAAFRSAVLTSTMAPGINGYVFANMYGRARRVAASSVLMATSLSILTVWGWLHALP